jgi:hypothetical protein
MTHLSIFEYKNNMELQREQQNKVININKCKKIAKLFWKCSFEKKTKDQCKDEYNMIIRCIEKIHN